MRFLPVPVCLTTLLYITGMGLLVDPSGVAVVPEPWAIAARQARSTRSGDQAPSWSENNRLARNAIPSTSRVMLGHRPTKLLSDTPSRAVSHSGGPPDPEVRSVRKPVLLPRRTWFPAGG